MLDNKRDITQQSIRIPQGSSAPPPFLFWLVIGLFITFVIAAAASFFAYRAEGRLVAIVPIALLLLIAIPVYTVLLAIILRRTLPRGFVLWLLAAFAILIIIGGFAGLSYYRDQLPPRYQVELITQLPILNPVFQALLPPTPAGGVVPTVAVTELGPSAAELLLGPLADPTAAPVLTEEPTPTQTPPTPTPTVEPATQPQEPPATAPIPTLAAAAQAAPPQPTLPPVQIVSADTDTFSLPSTAYNGGFSYFRQEWNNCGPANVAMALSYYGWQGDQSTAAAYLKPDREDKNVSPTEIVSFVNETTFVRAVTRVGGSIELIKAFVSAGFPIIVEVGGLLYEGDDWVGHYRTIVGYDDMQRTMRVFDSWLGNGNGDGIAVPYNDFDATWQPFNRVFIVIYEPAREAAVMRILGDLADDAAANEHALEIARAEARANPQSGFAWFNIGSSLTRLGRYDEAQHAFDQARRFNLPFRMLWYQFYPFEAYFNVGRYTDVLALVNSGLNNGGEYVEETHYWHGRVLAEQGSREQARAAFQRALRHNPRFAQAQAALDTLNGN